MALKKENIEAMAKVLGLDAAKVAEAFTSETEVTIDVPDGTFIPKSEEEDYKKRLTQPVYEEGKKAGVEIAVKEWKQKEGITVEGKTLDVLIPALKAKVIEDAKIPADEKVKEVQRRYDTLLQQHETAVKEKDSTILQLQNGLKSLNTETAMLSLVPDGLTGLKPNQFIKLFKMEYDPDIDETGSLVAKQNGKIVLGDLAKPRAISDLMTEFAIENKWVQKDGRGGGDGTGGGSGKYKNMAELMKDAESKKFTAEQVQHEIELFQKSQT